MELRLFCIKPSICPLYQCGLTQYVKSLGWAMLSQTFPTICLDQPAMWYALYQGLRAVRGWEKRGKLPDGLYRPFMFYWYIELLHHVQVPDCKLHYSMSMTWYSITMAQTEKWLSFSYIPSSAIRRSGSARYFSVRHYRIAEKFHNNDADLSLRSMFTFSRPITALLTGALAVQGHGQVTWPDTSICSFIG